MLVEKVLGSNDGGDSALAREMRVIQSLIATYLTDPTGNEPLLASS